MSADMYGEGYGEQPKKRSWVWVVGCGCLIVLLVIGGSYAGLAYAAMTMLKRTEIYAAGLEAARQSPEAQEALGTPIEAGFWVAGTYQVQNETGRADLKIPVSGPDGSGLVRVVGTKTGGEWTIEYIGLQLSGETTFRTLKGTPPDALPPGGEEPAGEEGAETLTI